MDDNFIPTTLEQCFEVLDMQIPSEDRETFKNWKEEDCCQIHFTTGMQLRNNWGLWRGGPLRDWFNDHDVWHPDDMSGIIITSYWRRLNKQPIRLEEQVKYYNDYWKANGINVKEDALRSRND